ncbi:MAG TPA: S-layer homology domain-containing protein, partial [Acidimicrobiia bacterium]
TIYFASETQGGIAGDPQVVLFRRPAAGPWQQHVVKTEDPRGSRFDRKRPVVAILDEAIYVISIDNARSESSYQRATLNASGVPGTWSGLTKIFATMGETVRNNIVPREPVTSARGLPVLIDNLADDTIWRTVLPNTGNLAPGVDAGPDITVGRGTPAKLFEAKADNSLDGGIGDPLKYQWTKVSGPGNVTFAKATDLNPSVTFHQEGKYVLRLTVTESGTNPLSNWDEITVTVDPKNDVPKVTITKPANGAQVTAGTKVTFSATATDQEDGNISSKVVWTSSRDGQIGKGASFTKSNLSVGTHTIKATVVDRQNASASATITLKVVPKPNAPGNPGGPGQPGSPGNPPGEPIGPDNPFGDDNGHVFENDIEWLANKGITRGCNPPTNDRFCPDDFVTRGQMAAFLVRAFSYTDDGGGSRFVDDNGHVFEADIARLAAAGVTKGCNPPKNDRFCPDDFVTRGQMAAFLHRAIGDD